ncbi:uncharacterized protein DUF4395 [Microcella putealis]|uniref:Uncharacterized protein DUF4395 n=1 Tax=Microcella putealis TaxID=337005 RepID=A0A4Q7LTP8_9MICO|nr:DUF4395 domain-containing protein [Microcella putealis]RZS57642.1 uncharacterized protein DUF4395 [Microcella putealis]TQM24709.1 uncharacterized protein DUF4395 [Microcella putealis]
MSATSPAARPGIDPRGPRFGASITSVLLLVVIALGLATPLGGTLVERLTEPAAVLQTLLVALFAWGAFAGIARHPYGAVFRTLIAPRLGAPTEREDPAAPTFAQGVGLLVTGVGLALHLAGVPYALVASAAAAFVAAFLNAAFAYCLGCQLYVLLVRAGLLGRKTA